MNVLEMQIMAIWVFTDTANGCRAGLKTLDMLERAAPTIDESDLIKWIMEVLHVKGNMILAGEL